MGVDLSATLPALLAQKNWTQDKLADATGIRRTDINALARGRLSAGPGRLTRIADALGVSVLELGAPASLADEQGETLLGHLEELAELVARGFAALGVTQDQLRPGADARTRTGQKR